MDKKRAKQQRAEEEARRRELRKPIIGVLFGIKIMIGGEVVEKWLQESQTLSELLRRFAREWFGDKTDVAMKWERSLCNILSDIAISAMSKTELVERDVSTPKLLLEWFADYTERVLPKRDLDLKSELYSQKNMQPIIDIALKKAGNASSAYRAAEAAVPKLF